MRRKPTAGSWTARRGPSITTPTFLPAAGWISARVSSCSIYRLIRRRDRRSGCGNGVIGLQALAQNPNARVMFTDESHMAVASSRLNVERNLPDDIARCEFMVNNSLSGIEPDRFTAILCNPPFHQQHAITDHIARQMFNDARRSLKYGGELYVVGNRHLDYFRKLKRVFGNCTTIATNNKFVILKATKVRKQR